MFVAGIAAVGFAGLTFVARKTVAVLIAPGFAKTNTIALDHQAQFPPFITVVVSSSITQSGSMIAGDIPKLAIVQINPGYASSPGQDNNGTVVGVICQRPLASDAKTQSVFVRVKVVFFDALRRPWSSTELRQSVICADEDVRFVQTAYWGVRLGLCSNHLDALEQLPRDF